MEYRRRQDKAREDGDSGEKYIMGVVTRRSKHRLKRCRRLFSAGPRRRGGDLPFLSPRSDTHLNSTLIPPDPTHPTQGTTRHSITKNAIRLN